MTGHDLRRPIAGSVTGTLGRVVKSRGETGQLRLLRATGRGDWHGYVSGGAVPGLPGRAPRLAAADGHRHGFPRGGRRALPSTTAVFAHRVGRYRGPRGGRDAGGQLPPALRPLRRRPPTAGPRDLHPARRVGGRRAAATTRCPSSWTRRGCATSSSTKPRGCPGCSRFRHPVTPPGISHWSYAVPTTPSWSSDKAKTLPPATAPTRWPSEPPTTGTSRCR